MLVPRWRVGRGLVLHDKAVSMVEVFPSGDRLLTWGRERVATVWSVTKGDVLIELGSALVTIIARIFPDEDRVVVGSLEDHRAVVWSVTSRRRHRELVHSSWLMDLGVMNNGALVAALQFDGWVAIWCAATGAKLRMLGEASSRALDLANGFKAFAHGARLVTFSSTRMTVWNASSGERLWRRDTDNIDSIVVAPGGDALVTCGSGAIKFWEVHSGYTSPTLHESPSGEQLGEVPNDCLVGIGFAGVLDPHGFGWRAS